MSPQLLIGVTASLALASLAWLNLSLVPQLREQGDASAKAARPELHPPPATSACPSCPECPPTTQAQNPGGSVAAIGLAMPSHPALPADRIPSNPMAPAAVHSAELAPDASPEQAGSTAVAQTRRKLAAQVFFGEKLATRLDGTARKTLKSMVAQLDLHDDARLLLRAHADRRGRARFNRRLARRRADSVHRFLRRLGIRGARMTIESIGERDALGLPEAQFRSLRQDRRVDVVLVQGE